jgi:protein phosphatase
MTKEEALGKPESSRLTAFVGMTAPASPAVYVTKIRPGDRILLCSDGLYSMVSEREIVRIMRSSRSPTRICQRLINKANDNGGRDNISVAYVKIR